jgi:hypothetical protein
MCSRILIDRQYKCGCIAPKPSNNTIYRCASWERRRTCETNQLFSYLDVDCSVSCSWEVGSDNTRAQQEDWYLQNGPYQGEPSEEDYHFHRVPPQLSEPVFLRKCRKRRVNAVPKEWLDAPEARGFVAHDVGKYAEQSDGEEVDSDIVVDDSKQEEHVSSTNFGDRLWGRKK